MKGMMEPLRIGPIGEGQVAAFAEVSGDANPLHVSKEIARTIGLDAAPVHGMLLVAYLHEAVRRHQPDAVVTGLSTRFMAPVPVGETIEITGRVVKQGGLSEALILRLMVRTGAGTLACMAEATLAPPPAGWR
ncbi:MaoC family dehydratase [Labrys okinawensis]|uniref:MaoC family dehydratase n=1 Tax=Labrys okinawensis TaxID=346911 RepID=UPI0039BD82DA